jgi:uncharacterized protein YciI
MGTTLFLVFRDPGPGWVPGRPTREQPGWDEHALFMDGIFERGRIVLAGPYADDSRVLLIVRASNRDEAAHLLDGDPWNATGILAPPEIIEWNVFLDRGMIASKEA